MATCPRCGAPTQDNADNCPNCGQLPHAPVSPPPPPPPPPPGAQISPEEWRAYLGKNADYYLGQFARFGLAGVDNFVATWHWPALFTTAVWFLYRKLYLWFALALVGFFVPYINFAVWLACPLCANFIYYTEAKKQILAVKQANPGQNILPLLAQLGGVHAWVPPVAIAVSVIYFFFIFLIMAWLGVKLVGLFLGPLLGMLLMMSGQHI